MPTLDNVKFPNIPVKHWWTLRSKFKQSIPTTVTPGYIGTVLGIEDISAKTNIIPSLIQFKIIDEEGKPLERAKNWRDDNDYKTVCEEIRKEIYPKELLEALPGPNPDSDAVKRWFGNKLGVGRIAQGRLSAVYNLLQKADVADELITKPSKKTPKKSKSTTTTNKKQSREKTEPEEPKLKETKSPSVHVDIQIHISPDSSKEQIDHIFENLAKYYKN